MKTFMKFGAVVAVALACGAASADYLYGMIDNAYYYYNGENPTFNYFTVKGKSNDNKYTDALPIYTYTEQDDDYTTTFPSDNTGHSSSGAPNDGFYVKFDGDAKSYQTFLFEMFNDNSSTPRVAWQEFTYKDVADHVFKEGEDMPTANPLVVSRVVPEPTSALLSLFGLAALALRRRKMA